jgi:hypothetical protein
VIGEWVQRFRRTVEGIGAGGALRPCAFGPDCAFAVRPPEKPKPQDPSHFPRVPAPELLPGPGRIEQPSVVHFRCECGKILKVKWELAGKTGRCPSCQKLIQIPDA